MGAVASTPCMKACCGNCFRNASGKKGASGKHRSRSHADTAQDDADMWFEQDKVPLLSARHDHEIVSDGAVVKKVVMMRSAQHVDREGSRSHRARSSSSDRASTAAGSPSSRRGGRSATMEDKRPPSSSPSSPSSHGHGAKDSPHSSNDDGSWEFAPASPEREPISPTTPKSRRSKRQDSGGTSPDAKSDATVDRHLETSAHRPDEKDAHHRRSQRSMSAASEGTRGDDNNGREGRDDDYDDQDRGGDAASPRSQRSPSKSSTGSASSPKRKTRYGRKNYRANSDRKKTT